MIGSRVDPGDEDLEGRRSRNDTKCDFDLTSCCRSFAADRAESPILPYLTDERTAVDDPLLHKGGLRDFVANGRRVQIPPIGEILEANHLGDRSSRPIDRQCASFLKAAVDEGIRDLIRRCADPLGRRVTRDAGRRQRGEAHRRNLGDHRGTGRDTHDIVVGIPPPSLDSIARHPRLENLQALRDGWGCRRVTRHVLDARTGGRSGADRLIVDIVEKIADVDDGDAISRMSRVVADDRDAR